MSHKPKVKVEILGDHSRVWLDDYEVHGLRSYSLTHNAHEPVEITLVITGAFAPEESNEPVSRG